MEQQLQTQLVKAAPAGDIESFGRLCSYYYAPMVAIAYSVLADHHLAEDAAQETFARALQNLKKLNNTKKFAPWLAQICRNVAIDATRRSVRQLPQEDNCQPDIAQEHCIRDERHLVKDAISALPTGDRELIVLRFYDGLSYEQISAVLGLSGPTINGRLARAKRKLAKHLRRKGILE